ncbi:aldo-keto reductase [Aulographum hederae CBS 113979]|uniref:Aldo-keto reductase n=1 Tax=Aulographum hederae CBS 113979 TaxID=1176131 RepID=A0A6G1GPR2_9PEZI|nr:aldo-keto reductase [Aulographum hederae CBS 113979]
MSDHPKLPTRPLGKDGPQLPRLGVGLMGLSGTYGLPAPDEDRLAFLDELHKRGKVFWDTADEYNDNEDLIGKWFAANPNKRKDIFLATKFAIRKNFGNGPGGLGVDSSPAYCHQAIESSLRRLGVPYVDLYYVHRLDKMTPIEKTMEAMVELKKAGKIKYIGLSECSAESLRRAYAVHPVAAVQLEYSAFYLAIESPKIKLLETARELGVAVVAYTPLGHGFLTGSIRKREDFTKPGDQRGILPQLSEANLDKNLAVVDKISDIAKAKGVTAAQLGLAWLLAQGDDIFPIPGTTKIHRLEENLGSMFVSLSSEEDQAIRELAQGFQGDRFQDSTGFSYGNTPPL